MFEHREFDYDGLRVPTWDRDFWLGDRPANFVRCLGQFVGEIANVCRGNKIFAKLGNTNQINQTVQLDSNTSHTLKQPVGFYWSDHERYRLC